MATKTENLGLTKPEETDAPDISVINGNMDILDSKVKEALDSVELDSEITE